MRTQKGRGVRRSGSGPSALELCLFAMPGRLGQRGLVRFSSRTSGFASDTKICYRKLLWKYVTVSHYQRRLSSLLAIPPHLGGWDWKTQGHQSGRNPIPSAGLKMPKQTPTPAQKAADLLLRSQINGIIRSGSATNKHKGLPDSPGAGEI